MIRIRPRVAVAQALRPRIGMARPFAPIVGSDSAPAYLDIDYVQQQQRWNGVTYRALPSLLSAAGGAASGGWHAFGPYVDPTETNIITNGTFDTDTTDWQTNGAIAAVGGELELTANNQNIRAFSQTIADRRSRAFRYRGTYRRGSSGNTQQLGVSTANSSLGAGIFADNATTTNRTDDLILSTGNGDGWVGGRNAAMSGSGTGYFDNLTLVEVWPCKGFPQGVFSAVIDAVTPAEASGNKVVWQGDAGTERDRIRLVWGADKHLHLIVTLSATATADRDLGEVLENTRFKVAFSVRSNNFRFAINGVSAAVDNSGGCPGIAYMRIGSGVSSGAWDGRINRVTIMPNHEGDDWLAYITAPDDALWAEGDSYMAGALGVFLWQDIATQTGRVVVPTAAGGSTFAEIRDRIMARPWLRNRKLVIWDGSSNGYGSVANMMATLAEIVAWKGDDNWLFIPPVMVSPVSEGNQTVADMAAVRDQAIALYGADHVFDSLPTLFALAIPDDADDAFDVLCGVPPRSLMLDAAHLNQEAMTAVAQALPL